MTTTIPQIFISVKPPRKTFLTTRFPQPTKSFTRKYVRSSRDFKLLVSSHDNLLSTKAKDYIFSDELKRKNKRRMVVVRFNNLGFNGGGGGGGRDGNTARVLGNLALAIGLTYLSMTGQLGWLLDAIVSLWLLVVLVPIVGLGVLIWWAARDMVQSNCPNCGNEFQVFKSTLTEEAQLCPYCSQPFSVVGNEFVRDPVKFSNESPTFGEAFSDLSSRSKKGKAKSGAVTVIDVEAEVKDVD